MLTCVGGSEVFSFDIVTCLFFFKQKTAYEIRISDWSSDVCSSDLTQQYFDAQQPYAYVAHHLVEDSRNQVELSTEIEVDGRTQKLEGRGNGPIDAFIAGLSQLIGEKDRKSTRLNSCH